VAELPLVAERSTVPVEIKEYFAGRGMRTSLASALPSEIARRSGVQAHPLVLEEIANEEDRKKIRSVLLRSGFREREGIYLRSDTTLYLQPQAQYEAIGFESYRKYLEALPSDDSTAQEMADALPGGVRHGVEVIPRQRAPSAADAGMGHVEVLKR
jgi:hypothetical protein